MKTAKVVSILGRFQGSFRAALFASAQPHSCKYKNKSAIKRVQIRSFYVLGTISSTRSERVFCRLNLNQTE
jgi:hypothetical protein